MHHNEDHQSDYLKPSHQLVDYLANPLGMRETTGKTICVQAMEISVEHSLIKKFALIPIWPDKREQQNQLVQEGSLYMTLPGPSV